MRSLIFPLLLLALFPSVALNADRPVPFRAGEVLTYDVSWTRFVTAGTATLAVRDRRAAGAGKSSYYIVAEAKPTSFVENLYHVYYKAESFLDTETLRPSMATVYSDERGRKRRRVMRFKGGNTADYEVQASSTVKSEFKTQPGTLDPISALYVVRTLPLKEGHRTTVPFASNGKNYRLNLAVGRRETVKTGLGQVTAWRVTPTVQDENGRPTTTRNLTLWVSDDARKLPLRMEVDLPVGAFALTLSSVK
jgi:hypothetical protein